MRPNPLARRSAHGRQDSFRKAQSDDAIHGAGTAPDQIANRGSDTSMLVDMCTAGSGCSLAASISRTTHGSAQVLKMRRPRCCEDFLLLLRPRLRPVFSRVF